MSKGQVDRQEERQVRHRLTAILGAAFSLVVFLAALYALHRALQQHQMADIVRGLERIPMAAVGFSLLATAGSYLALSGFDWLALHHIQRSLSLRRIVLASFVSHAVSHNTGFGALTGGAIRYRIYSTAGLSVLEVAGVVVFCGLTFALGASSLAAAALAAEPAAVAELLHVPAEGVRALASLAALAIVAYLLLGRVRQRPLTILGRRLEMPGLATAVAQVLVSAADLCCAAAALYLLLPNGAEVSYPAFVGVYVLSIFAGLVAHVPGGLGVFETSVILLVPGAPADQMFGALLAFRVIYFLLPLLLGAVLLAAHEGWARAHSIRRASVAARLWARELQPAVASACTFACGTLLYFLAILRPGSSEKTVLTEASSLAMGLLGALLLVLARPVNRRLGTAHSGAVAISVVANALAMVRGQYWLAAALAVVAALLAVLRHSAYRRASLLKVSLPAAWSVALVSVFLAGVWLMVLDLRNEIQQVEMASDIAPLWPVARSLGVVGGSAFLLVAAGMGQAAWRRHQGKAVRTAELAALVAQSPHAIAHLAYHADIHHLAAQNGRAAILYRRKGDAWVAVGEPVGESPEWTELAWEFREYAEENGGRPIFWNVPYRPIYLDLGLSFVRIGDAACLGVGEFDLNTPAHGQLRHLYDGAAQMGCSIDIRPPCSSSGDQLNALVSQWGLEAECSQAAFGSHHPHVVVRLHDEVVAFGALWMSGDGGDLAVDVIRRAPHISREVEYFLLAEVLAWARQRGYRTFDLGLAPAANVPMEDMLGLEGIMPYVLHRRPCEFSSEIPRWQEVFRPQWRPRYMAVPVQFALRPASLAGA